MDFALKFKATLKVSEPNATKHKKPPKSFLSISPSILVANSEATAQATSAGSSKKDKLSVFTSPFFICSPSAIVPDGKKAMRFANCAVS